MRTEEIPAVISLISDWCEAHRQWSHEMVSTGFPSRVTRRRLYYAGRALFDSVDAAEPKEGSYARNRQLERGTEVYFPDQSDADGGSSE